MGKIHFYLEDFLDLLQQGCLKGIAFLQGLPKGLRIALMVLTVVSLVNVIAAVGKAISQSKQAWKRIPGTNLMYSFFHGSGQFQRKRIHRLARHYLLDAEWSVFSFAGLGKRLGRYENDTFFVPFLLSFLYLALTIVGFGEMILRGVLGLLIYFVVNLAYMLFLLAMRLVYMILTPIVKTMDKASQSPQHCQKCYTSFKLPLFLCPQCGTGHPMLQPGKCGLLWAKCSCGKILPCASLSNRKKLVAHCTSCSADLYSGSLSALNVQIVGTQGSGKTSYIAAAQHRIRTLHSEIAPFPHEDAAHLEDSFAKGRIMTPTGEEQHVCKLIRYRKRKYDEAVVMYDMSYSHTASMSDDAAKQFLNLGYIDGAIITIDPLQIPVVRKQCNGMILREASPEDGDAEEYLINFINQYSTIVGRSAAKMSDLPVAIAIVKADVPMIQGQIGPAAVQKRQTEGASGSWEEIQSRLCREYLLENGLENVLLNIECVFRNVAYFAVSSTGGCKIGTHFAPQNVDAPLQWIGRKNGFPINHFLGTKEGDA